MTAKKMHNIAVPLAVLLSGSGLALFMDSAAVMYALVTFSVMLAGLYAGVVFTGKLDSNITVHQVAVAFFLWSGASIIFGLRSLQIQSLPIVLCAGLVLSLAAGYAWVRGADEHSALWRIITLITFEWFIILLFAPGSYMVLGALLTIGVVTLVSLFEKGSEEMTRRSVIKTLASSLIIAAFFILGFRWLL